MNQKLAAALHEAAMYGIGATSDYNQGVILQAAQENKRLRLFLGAIAAMGPADEEWDADTLEGAVCLAKRALGIPEQGTKEV